MISLARRNLLEDRARLLISAGGMACAVLLVLAFDGLLAGLFSQLTTYIDHVGAHVYVAEPSVRTMHMVDSSLPVVRVSEIRSVDGVAFVEPILFAESFVSAGDRSQMAHIYGYNPASGRAGPWNVLHGSSDLKPGEAALDSVAAARLGVGLGDEVTILGDTFRVRALTRETYCFTSAIAFIRTEDFARLRSQRQRASYFLVWLAPGITPEEGARRIRASVPEVEVVPRAEFAVEQVQSVRDTSAEIVVVLNVIGFIVGVAAAGLVMYTATRAKTREYGVLKALGATNGVVYRLVLEQALWSVGLGAIIALCIAFGLSRLMDWVAPTVPILIEAPSVLKAFASAGSMALIASVVPIRQIAHLDPATVFRR